MTGKELMELIKEYKAEEGEMRVSLKNGAYSIDYDINSYYMYKQDSTLTLTLTHTV